jgi:hypothetical protein
MTEWWIVKHALPHLRTALPAAKPIELSKREGPDFALQAGDAHFGIEMTQCLAPNGGWVDAIADELGLEYRPWTDSERRKRTDRPSIISELEKHPRGFEGDEPERLFAQCLAESVSDKSKLLPKYAPADQHWLIVFDNFAFPGLDKAVWYPIWRDIVSKAGFQKIALLSGGGEDLMELDGSPG